MSFVFFFFFFSCIIMRGVSYPGISMFCFASLSYSLCCFFLFLWLSF